MVPEKLIEEQRATTVREALRNVSGITVSAGEGGRQGDIFILRGFSAQTDTFRDGVRDLGWFTRDTFNLGGVEVFFGPSAVLFGRGSTGGAVNLTTKRPAKQSTREVSLTGGTAPWGRLDLDVNQVLTEAVQLRVNVAGQLARTAGRDSVEQNRAAVTPAARIALGQNTTLDLDYLYQREQGIPDHGQPYFNGSSLTTSLGVPLLVECPRGPRGRPEGPRHPGGCGALSGPSPSRPPGPRTRASSGWPRSESRAWGLPPSRAPGASC